MMMSPLHRTGGGDRLSHLRNRRSYGLRQSIKPRPSPHRNAFHTGLLECTTSPSQKRHGWPHNTPRMYHFTFTEVARLAIQYSSIAPLHLHRSGTAGHTVLLDCTTSLSQKWHDWIHTVSNSPRPCTPISRCGPTL